jgi:hypothetical protein
MEKSRMFYVLFVLIITQTFVGSQAFAGLILISGDSNIGNPLDGSAGAPINANNSTWFNNILGSGTTVKIQNDNITQSGFVDSASAIHNFYNTQGGVSSSLVVAGTTINDALLTGVDLYISMLPSDDFTTPELNALSAYLSGGGSVFFMGELEGSDLPNIRINSALTFLGSSMSILDASLDLGFTTTSNIDSDPLNAGVSSFTFAASSAAVGGTSLIHSTNNTTIIAYEDVAAVPVPAAIWLFGSGLFGFMGIARRKKAT